MTHTRGPWRTHFGRDVTGYPCYFIHGFSGEQKRDEEMHTANANLIAAAPEMYELICDFLHGYCDEKSDEFRERRSDLAYKMRLVKNKAEGK